VARSLWVTAVALGAKGATTVRAPIAATMAQAVAAQGATAAMVVWVLAGMVSQDGLAAAVAVEGAGGQRA
jgi:hypothetical protein